MSNNQFDTQTRAPFPFGECAFYGFNAIKGNVTPFFMRVALPYFVLAIALSTIPMLFIGDYFRWIASVGDMQSTDEAAQVLATFARYGLGFVALILVSIIIYSATVNAAYRWYLNRDLSGSFGALRFGMDEVRTFLIVLFYFLFIFFVPYVIFIVLIGVTSGLMAVGSGAAAGMLALMMLVFFPGMIAFMVFFGIRLSLCVPLSLERKQFVFWDSMRLTKKRGWALLGTYLILGLVYFVAYSILSTIGQIMLMGNFMSTIMQAAEGKVSDAQMLAQMADSLSSPGTIAGLIVYGMMNAALSTISLFAFAGLTAYSMRFLQEEKGDIVGNLEVFD